MKPLHVRLVVAAAGRLVGLGHVQLALNEGADAGLAEIVECALDAETVGSLQQELAHHESAGGGLTRLLERFGWVVSIVA
jgi:hypothetical protein